MRLLNEECKSYAKHRGWTEKDLHSIGAFTWGERIAFPITTYSGEEVGYVGRDLKKKQYIFEFTKQFWSYFLWKGLDENEKTIVLCEGPFDLGWLYNYGFHAAAYLGSGLNQAQARVISRFYDNAIFIMDNDSAGLMGFKRSERILQKLEVEVYSIRTVGCKDLSELCEHYPDRASAFVQVLKDRLRKIQMQDSVSDRFQGLFGSDSE